MLPRQQGQAPIDAMTLISELVPALQANDEARQVLRHQLNHGRALLSSECWNPAKLDEAYLKKCSRGYNFAPALSKM